MKDNYMWTQAFKANNLLNISRVDTPLLIKKENILFVLEENQAESIKSSLRIKFITELPANLKVRSYIVTFSDEYGYDMYECHWSVKKICSML